MFFDSFGQKCDSFSLMKHVQQFDEKCTLLLEKCIGGASCL